MSADLDDRRRAAYARATRVLSGHPPRTQAAWLSVLAAEAARADGDPLGMPDQYGEGGGVEVLEAEVGALLGKPAAVLMPSGVMAQQAALRAWTERTGHATVGLHALSHLVVHEMDAPRELHRLRPVVLARSPRPVTAADLADVPEPLGAVTVELPLRDAGYLLPTWDELVALSAAARARGVPLHLDGARLWESGPCLDNGYAEIAGLADSVYVSLYKGLGGLAGAVLAGPQELVDDARRWRRRHGGTLPTLFPLAVAARAGLRDRLPRMAGYVEHAARLATALDAEDALRVFPSPPHTNAFRLFLPASPDRLAESALGHAEHTGVFGPTWFTASDVPGWSFTEITVGDATLGWSPDEVVALVLGLVAASAVEHEPGMQGHG